MVRWFETIPTVDSVIFHSFFRQKLTFAVSSSRSVSWIDQRCGNQNGCKKKDATDSHFRKPKNLAFNLRFSSLFDKLTTSEVYFEGNVTEMSYLLSKGILKKSLCKTPKIRILTDKNTGNTTKIHFHERTLAYCNISEAKPLIWILKTINR